MRSVILGTLTAIAALTATAAFAGSNTAPGNAKDATPASVAVVGQTVESGLTVVEDGMTALLSGLSQVYLTLDRTLEHKSYVEHMIGS